MTTAMTTHELARRLLAGPDQPVYVVNEDASAPEPVIKVEELTVGDFRHHYTDQPLEHDANGDLLPENYSLVVA